MTQKNSELENILERLTPQEIVSRLDSYIIGQTKAKKAVAIALRNRTRRLKLAKEIRDEVTPKNILMIGPTGVGKTEIARRLAKLCSAPFLKVEATKYTEVGYVGRDVESMVRDLMNVAYNLVKSEKQAGLKEKARQIVEEKILDLLLPGMPKNDKVENNENLPANNTREKLKKMLAEGLLENSEVDLAVKNRMPPLEFFGTGSFDDLQNAMENLSNTINEVRNKKRRMTVSAAREILLSEELDNLTDMDSVSEEAKMRVEQMGIIFIDEIDKIATQNDRSGDNVSREGVQRDILPIVEGSNVNTKYGVVDTTHILFIGAGAFNIAKPNDLIPELQGRFPLRVELEALTKEDFIRILKEPKNSLTKQYKELLATEEVELEFTDSAIEKMSEMAVTVNSEVESIGARRLHTILETVLDDISFTADLHKGEKIVIDDKYVEEKLKTIAENRDLSRYVL